MDIRIHGKESEMKNLRIVLALLVIAASLIVASDRSSMWACGGSGNSTCVVTETACLRTMVLAKGASTVVVIAPGSPTVFNAPAIPSGKEQLSPCRPGRRRSRWNIQTQLPLGLFGSFMFKMHGLINAVTNPLKI